MATARTRTTTTRVPAAAKKPADRKPAAATAADEENSMIATVEIDGMSIEVNLAPVRNVRLMRRVKHDDLDALIEMFEQVFGDALDEIEERFDLNDIEDYAAFLKRAMGAVDPNSRRS